MRCRITSAWYAILGLVEYLKVINSCNAALVKLEPLQRCQAAVWLQQQHRLVLKHAVLCCACCDDVQALKC
jgi:hypothetical protein